MGKTEEKFYAWFNIWICETMKLKDNVVEIGDILYTEVVNWETEIIEGLDEIDYVYGSCFCTNPSIEGNKLKVMFNVKAAVGELKPNEFKSQPKYVDIYLNKDEREFISDPLTKKRITNENKQIIKIPIAYRAHGKLT